MLVGLQSVVVKALREYYYVLIVASKGQDHEGHPSHVSPADGGII